MLPASARTLLPVVVTNRANTACCPLVKLPVLSVLGKGTLPFHRWLWSVHLPKICHPSNPSILAAISGILAVSGTKPSVYNALNMSTCKLNLKTIVM